MTGRGKGAAVADVAADLGTAVARTGAAAEKPAQGAGGDGAGAIGGAAGAGDEGELGDLFAGLDADLAEFDGATIRPPKRGRGRPVGSVNRSTKDVLRWLSARGYRDPLEFLAALYTADPRELAADLAGHGDVRRVTPAQALDVLELQRKAAGEALGYVHQRAPTQVEITGEAARPLIIINDAAVAPRLVGGAGAARPALNSEELQSLAPVDMVPIENRSHENRSHDNA